MAAERKRLRQRKKRVVFTNGCFDLLHVGHARYLQQARALGNRLIVGLNSDTSARTLKGPKRPLVPEHERAELLATLSCVDYVVIFDDLTAERLVEVLKPDVYTKGGDYARDQQMTPEQWEQRLPEARIVASYGGRVVILPLTPGHSTTDLIRRIVEIISDQHA
ncbi:MAG: D-glycero-beta-D-manno-heptose 1-phosphate adenylyltransferase [Chloroflexi bacterium]|nr:D-glycero-beta-D-manno-heptose 1-phosphate adenylyltransferase [Chloroflexota bacterium]